MAIFIEIKTNTGEIYCVNIDTITTFKSANDNMTNIVTADGTAHLAVVPYESLKSILLSVKTGAKMGDISITKTYSK